MFQTSGTYESVYGLEGKNIRDTIAFYPTRDGGQVGIGHVDPENWRLIILVDALGGVTYEEIENDTLEVLSAGTASFIKTQHGDFEGEWRSIDPSTKVENTDYWQLVHKLDN
jgi:hypothetical protein